MNLTSSDTHGQHNIETFPFIVYLMQLKQPQHRPLSLFSFSLFRKLTTPRKMQLLVINALTNQLVGVQIAFLAIATMVTFEFNKARRQDFVPRQYFVACTCNGQHRPLINMTLQLFYKVKIFKFCLWRCLRHSQA